MWGVQKGPLDICLNQTKMNWMWAEMDKHTYRKNIHIIITCQRNVSVLLLLGKKRGCTWKCKFPPSTLYNNSCFEEYRLHTCCYVYNKKVKFVICVNPEAKITCEQDVTNWITVCSQSPHKLRKCLIAPANQLWIILIIKKDSVIPIIVNLDEDSLGSHTRTVF